MKLPKDSDGKLSSYAWPGGYPIFYLDKANEILCPGCAEENKDNELESFRPVTYAINWEDTTLICFECNESIESAYGEIDDN